MNPIILTRNLFDTATLSSVGFETTMPIAYMKMQDRSLQAQSTGLDFGSPSIGPSLKGSYLTEQSIDMFALRYHNLTAAATWRLILYDTSNFINVIYDSGFVSAFPYTDIPADLTPNYFRLMKNSAMYFPIKTTVKSWQIQIKDSANPDGVIKISRGFCGAKWEWSRGIKRGTFPIRFGSLGKSGRAYDGSKRSTAGANFIAYDLDHALFNNEADLRALLDAFAYLDITKDFWFSLFPGRGTWLEMYFQNAVKLPDDKSADLYFINAARSRLTLESN